MKCSVCDHENQDTSRFCTDCGAQLQSSAVLGQLLPPGATLHSNQYIVGRMLGEGGMGAVYLATDRSSGEKCAVKELRDNFGRPQEREEAVGNFEREIDILKNLYHVSIPEFFDTFTEGRRHYLVMEYVEGNDLEKGLTLRDQNGKSIRPGKPIPWAQVTKYAIQICDVLTYLHNHQPDPIVYRDLKPANVMISNDGHRLVLGDFGIARFFAARAKGTAIGTPGYIPPEQYTGTVEPRSDLYALAATIHHLVTDMAPDMFPPFKLPRLKTLAPQVPAWLDAIVDINLREAAADRYDSAEQLRRDLTSKQVTKTSVCPQCEYRNPPGSAYCDGCAYPMSRVTIICRNCSTANVINSRYCISCGKQI